MMLGLLLARAGVEVTVFEKHPDFLRDFRGDTVHPSTMELIEQLGLMEKFKKIPQGRVQSLGVREDLHLGSLAELDIKYPYIALTPQWEFLNMLAEEARRYPQFHLLMQSEVTGVIREGERIAGVRYRDPQGRERELRSLLTVASDGRRSTLRQTAGLSTHNFGAPFDVLWFRISKPETQNTELYFRVLPYRWIVGFDRRSYIQMAYVILKGTREKFWQAGIEEFRRNLAETIPELADRVNELKSFDDIKFLEVQVNRAPRWHLPGFLLIGDAAHAMSPMGGVGVNYAVQDAVATANILAAPLLRAQRDGQPLPERLLSKVQRRRQFPTVVIQNLQRIGQQRLIEPALLGRVTAVPKFARFMQHVGPVRRLLLRKMALGVRQEHIESPVQKAASPSIFAD